jgi:capsular polysaccharide export protein
MSEPANQPVPAVEDGGRPRRILFLQGPTSLFWRELAIAFEAVGHRTFKINVHLGEVLWWARRGAVNYRGRFSRWPTFLDAFVVKHGITDILYYADRQPYHVVAQDIAASRGINAIAIENGYLRPDWITLERGGMGVYSQFPDDPAIIRALARDLPEPDLRLRYPHGFYTEMVNEVAYHVTAWLYRGLYPFYRSGRYYNTIAEYSRGVVHLFGEKRRTQLAKDVVETLTSGRDPFYVVALQLQSDKQIRANSPFSHIGDMIQHVTASFAAHAPQNARLLFKQHPHDNGSENWPQVLARVAGRHGVADRVQLIAGGDLGRLLASARGCVIINSTVGLFAIRAGCPTKTLGIAIFDLPGLTHQGSLDDFWTNPDPIDGDLAADFMKALAATIQIKGSFYNREGRRAAIAEIVRRVASDCVNGRHDAIIPPRLAKARAMGVPIGAPPD